MPVQKFAGRLLPVTKAQSSDKYSKYFNKYCNFRVQQHWDVANYPVESIWLTAVFGGCRKTKVLSTTKYTKSETVEELSRAQSSVDGF